jgi:hypothetical protein
VTEPEFHESHVMLGHEGRRTPERLIIAALILLVLLVVKPWGPTPEVATAPGPVASVAPTAEVLLYNELPCSGLMWLVEADTRWAGDVVRSWILTDSSAATGPTDPGIKFVVVAAQQVLSIGYCPEYRDDSRPHDTVTIYRLTPTVAEVPTQRVSVPKEADAAANELFAPRATPGPSGGKVGPSSWDSGRYVMRIQGPEGYLRWLGVEIRLIAAASPSPDSSIAP